MKTRLSLLLIFLVIILTTFLADTSYDEGADGDLSGDRLNPTTLMLTPGSNVLTATSVAGDLEYVTVTVPAGFQLDALVLVAYTSANVQSFVALQSGSIFTEPPTGTNVSNLLGYTHFGTGLGQVGTDILDDIGGGAGAMGFTQPLSSGSYTLWLQETGAASATYTISLIISGVKKKVYLPILFRGG